MNPFAPDALKLCLVIGPLDCRPHDFFTVLEQAIDGGVSCIQLRDKNASPEQTEKLARQILKITPPNIPLIINDHVNVAKKLNCALHIGQTDMNYHQVREILGGQAIIGLSINNLFQAKQYKNCGANYFGIGPIFPTHSKSNATPPLGIDHLNIINKQLAPTPCIAIGGINPNNVASVFSAHIAGVAVISAIAQANNPKHAAQQLKLPQEQS